MEEREREETNGGVSSWLAQAQLIEEALTWCIVKTRALTPPFLNT